MAQHIGGFRRKTRSKLKRSIRQKGKFSITKFLQTFKEGEKVGLIADSIYQKGMFHPRFFGETGTVMGMQGSNYKVRVYDGSKEKILLVHPIHLRRMQ